MKQSLVIVESPAKAKTLEKFLGKDYRVKSSMGHIRDLAKKNIAIEIANNYRPLYEISEGKEKVVSELKTLVAQSDIVLLASDEDREGEAIAWHLFEALGLDNSKTKRIVFNEITKKAVLAAIKNPRSIDKHLVDAQQARRVLDRLVGFELSPVLWKKIKPALSAGRVQSVSVRLLVEREREIRDFKTQSTFRLIGKFTIPEQDKVISINAELNKRFENEAGVLDFLKKCNPAEYEISDVTVKPVKRSPSPPFTTSTLQQEASRKLGFSVSQTMSVAQKLYEAGKITYMRTDSVNLSDTAIEMAKQIICKEFGEKYSQQRQYKTKSKGAQEAHEAIRPTDMTKQETGGSAQEKRLYDLIWKRAVASQMSDASLEKTTVTIDISTVSEKYIATGLVVKFDGFLKLYTESTDDENEEEGSVRLPKMNVGQTLLNDTITATQKFSHHLPRYTEASLVKKLEELGIGRPSTYAPTIHTIQQRGYATKEDRQGTQRKYIVYTLYNGDIKKETKTETTGFEKAKLFPSDIGMIVNDFLIEHFADIMDYNFTASVEKEFDEIAEGNLNWTKMIDKFYRPFHDKIDLTLQTSSRTAGVRYIGFEPETNKPVSVKVGKYGPLVQIGETSDADKPRFAGLMKNQSIETITLEEALELFKLPRKIGAYENKEITTAVGRFGPYLLHNSKFYSLKIDVDNPLTVSLDRAIEVIEAKREVDSKKIIKIFDSNIDIQILNGRFGPYIVHNKENFKIPKTVSNPAILTVDDCKKIISESAAKPKKAGRKQATENDAKPKKASSKKTSEKSAPKKETIRKAKK
jgi:DNA topoisomerase-1